MSIKFFFNLLVLLSSGIFAQSYAPTAGLPGSTAINKNSPLFVQWASGITVERGYINIANHSATASGSNFASFGIDTDALGFPTGAVVSLGDAGTAILTFDNAIVDRDGYDFAVFENGSTSYLELAFVEVSSDGIHFFRFPSHSQTQTDSQLSTFASPEATYLNNLAGKYSSEYGTPFDISELPNNEQLDKLNIRFVKIIDVVGSINPVFASYDSFGNIVNDSFPTPFNSGGFDLQAVGVLNSTLNYNSFFQNTNIVLYPNPTTDIVFLNNAENTEISIYNTNGARILKVGSYENQGISVAHLPKGVYFVRVTFDNESKNLKFLRE